MSDVEKIKLGKITCRCKRETLYLELSTKTKTIGFKCPECGISGFSKRGEEAHAAFLEEVAKNAPATNPEGKPAPTPTPSKGQEKPGFDLSF